MADLKLKRIELRNWMKIKSAKLDFPSAGVVLVTGSNLASDGKLSSVGAGKTSLGEALSRALCGIDGRFTSLKDCSDDAVGKDTYVRVDADLLGKPLVVEIGYKCKELSLTGEGLRFTLDGKQVERGHIDQTRVELTKTLRVTPELAEWTVFLDGDKLKFNKIGQSSVVDLLMTALAQPPWTDYKVRSESVLGKFKRNLSGEESAHMEAKNRIGAIDRDIASARSRLVAVQDDYDSRVKAHESTKQGVKDQVKVKELVISNLSIQQTQAVKALKELEAKSAEEYAVLEATRSSILDREAVIIEKREKALEDHLSAKSVVAQTKTALQAMQKVPKDCPTCKKPWDKAHGEKELSNAALAVKTSETKAASVQKVYDAHNADYDAIKVEIRGVDTRMRQLGAGSKTSQLSSDYEQRKAQIDRTEREVARLKVDLARMEGGVDRAQVDRHEAVLDRIEKDKVSAQLRVEETAKSLAQSAEALKVIEYWHKAFGPTGIPNMVLTDTIAPLNSVAKRISGLMTGSTLEINFSTSRQLATGDAKSELVVKVNNRIGSKKMSGSSKGESGLTNLIIAETLSEVGSVSNRIGYRWYDEITNGQDPVIRRSLFSYMKEVAQRLGILVFVVDHSQEVASYADHVLIVEKSPTGTNLRWKR